MSRARGYNSKFYRELEQTRSSAGEILPIVFELLQPASIIDIGCGTGHWLAAAAELGISDFLGIDGEWALKAKLEIPRENFLPHHLSAPLSVNRKFDLAIALEVAEHLPESQARGFVQMLCGLSDKVLFSAAIPGQGGRHHVNEQWPVYWADIFVEFGFDCFDLLRPRIWENPRVLWYYAQNCMIFARKGAVKGPIPQRPLSLVHPQLWISQVQRLNSPGKLLERLPKATLARLRSKKP